MNILILPSWYPDNDNPINGVFFQEQAEALYNYFQVNKINASVTVFAFNVMSIKSIGKFLKSKKTLYKTHENGIDVWRLNYINLFPKMPFIALPVAVKIFKKQLETIQNIEKLKFDIVHIHSALNAGIFYSLANISLPYIITEHATFYARDLINTYQKRYLKNVFDNAKQIFVVGKGLMPYIQTYTKNRIDILFNIVKQRCVKIATDEDKKNFRFFSLGLGYYKKGFDVLIKAFAKVSVHIHDVELYIAGLNDDEKNILLKLALELNIPENQLRLFGPLSREDVSLQMNMCDCFCLLSRFETFGVVYAEALYYGKPIIGSKTGGPDSFCTDEVGLIVDIDDVEASAEALMHVYTHRDLYNADSIKRYAKENFSENVIAEKLYTTYMNVLHC